MNKDLGSYSRWVQIAGRSVKNNVSEGKIRIAKSLSSGLRWIESNGSRLEYQLSKRNIGEPGLKQSHLWMRSVTWSLIGATGCGVSFLALARTEEIAVVQGKLEPIGQVQEIRMPIGGVTEEVLVKEGEMVEAGQVLVQLDTEATSARRRSLEQSIDLKQQQLREKDDELRGYLQLNSTQQSTLENNIRLQEEIVRKLDILQKEGATAELQLLQERNRLLQTRGELSQAKVERERQGSIIRQQSQQLKSELSELRSRLSGETVNLRYQEIRSPVKGIVFDLKPKGAGFVAQTSEPILQIVPQDNLQASVEIPSRQIGFVKVGQDAEISIDSYPANDFGVLNGVVKRVSSDALPPDPSRGEQEYRYPGLISLNKQTLSLRDGRRLPLQAGMSLRAHIKLRSVSYLQLLMGGLQDRKDSLRQL